MNTKQKETLLGAIVALILVATIVSVALVVSGYFSPCNKTTSAVNADAVNEVLKAVEEAMAKIGEGNPYEGGVYIKAQIQYLGEGMEVIEKKDEDLKAGEVKKTTLKKVTVYGVKAKDLKATDDETHKALVKAIEGDTDKTRVVVVGKPVEFKDVTVDYGKENEDIPVVKQLLDKYKGGMHYFQDIEGKERVRYQRIDKK